MEGGSSGQLRQAVDVFPRPTSNLITSSLTTSDICHHCYNWFNNDVMIFNLHGSSRAIALCIVRAIMALREQP